MDKETRREYVQKMVDNLPVLRAKLHLTQKDLGELIGISHYSISGIENGQRKMTWNTFMSVLPIFVGSEETFQLLRIFDIYTDELDNFLHASPLTRLEADDLEQVAAAGENDLALQRFRDHKPFNR